jgi:HPt (histidine-containing phosphotransfer) domain-containing protein
MMHTEDGTIASGVDMPELLARVEYDHELLREVLDIFMEEFPELCRQLRAVVQQGDLEQVRIMAHTLKGMLASMSFGGASACAMRIERLAAQETQLGLMEEVLRLERTAARAQSSLAAMCDEVLR